MGFMAVVFGFITGGALQAFIYRCLMLMGITYVSFYGMRTVTEYVELQVVNYMSAFGSTGQAGLAALNILKMAGVTTAINILIAGASLIFLVKGYKSAVMGFFGTNRD